MYTGSKNIKCDKTGCDKIHKLLLPEDKHHLEIITPPTPGFSGHATELTYDDVFMRVLAVRLTGPAGSVVVNVSR